MKIYLKSCAVFALALTVPLSGCITVKCPDGSAAKSDAGYKIYVLNDAEMARLPESTYKNCPKTDPVQPPAPPPSGPVPTNLAPVLGGAGLLGAAMLGGGGSGTPEVQPTVPTQTTGRPTTSTR